MDLSSRRQEYLLDALDIETVDPCPFKQFEMWFKQASDKGIIEPNAMTLATVDRNGRPTQRTVLLKYFDKSGFVFFTNYASRKAQHIENNPHVSVLFPWFDLQRQVEINGDIQKVSTTESLKYFALRPRGSQLGAWVSQQSTVISARRILENKLAELAKKWASCIIPVPPAWGGYRIQPARFEFWQGGRDRLHDRIEYRLTNDGSDWQRQRLAP